MDQEVVEKVLLAHVQEQRRARRWGNFWRFITFAFVLGAFWFSSMGGGTHMVASPTMRHTAMIDLHGVIDFGSPASAELVSDSLREAFKNSHAAGIILRINSPGGSPVQSGIVFDEIRRLKAEHKDKPVIAVVEDVGVRTGHRLRRHHEERGVRLHGHRADVAGGEIHAGVGAQARQIRQLVVRPGVLLAHRHDGRSAV